MKDQIIKEWNKETERWEIVSGNESMSQIVYVLNTVYNFPEPKSNLFKSFCNTVLGINRKN